MADGKEAGTLSLSGKWTGYSQDDFEAMQMSGGVGDDTSVVDSTTVSGEIKEANKGGKNQQQKGGKGKKSNK